MQCKYRRGPTSNAVSFNRVFFHNPGLPHWSKEQREASCFISLQILVSQLNDLFAVMEKKMDGGAKKNIRITYGF